MTMFMGVVLVVLLGTLLELNSRRTFLAVRGLQAMRWQPMGAVPAMVTCFSSALMGSGGQTPGSMRLCLERACSALSLRGMHRPVRGACCDELEEKVCGSRDDGGDIADAPAGGCCGVTPQPRTGACCGAPSSPAASNGAPATSSGAGSTCEVSAGSCCGDSMGQRGAGSSEACGPSSCCSGAREQGVIASGTQQQKRVVEGPCHATEPRQIAACQELLDNRNHLAQERRKLALRYAMGLHRRGCRGAGVAM